MLLEVASHIVYDKEQADPCPFCGKDNLYIEDYREGTNSWKLAYGVVCRGCGTKGPKADGKSEAVDIWNKRSPVPPTLHIPRRAEP